MAQHKMLTDIHVHLEQYTAEELGLVLGHADDTGLRWIVTSGMDLKTSVRAVEIASCYKQVLPSVGIHPWIAAETFPDDIYEHISSLAEKEITVAIGEVGLDFVDNVFAGITYHDNEELQNAQQHAFRKQVELACSLKLPLIMHARGANSEVISILRDEKAYRTGGVIHNFDGDEETVDQLLDMGFYLSFGGAITYPSETQLRERVQHIPLDHILIETDSPYMPLYEQSTEKNEPANVARVAKTLAGLKKIDMNELILTIYRNFTTLLQLERPMSSTH